MTGTMTTERSYGELLAEFQPRPIQSEEDADRIQEIMDGLMDAGLKGQDETDFQRLLASLMFMWEADGKYDLPDNVPPHQLIKALLEVRGLKQRDLVGTVFPTKGIASEVLSGKRRLTYGYVAGLAEFFHVSPDTFFPKNGERHTQRVLATG